MKFKTMLPTILAAMCLTPFQATELGTLSETSTEVTFYSDDLLITQSYAKMQEDELIDELRLANHEHDRVEMRYNINRYFERHGCALAGQGDAFVDAGLESNVDPYFVAAISIIESTGGNHCVREHNAWGRKAGGANGSKYNRINSNGWCSWNSWDDAIHDEADYLARVYLDQGRTTVSSIARKYCPPTASSWRSNVRRVQDDMAGL